ncbi:hypothetical protein [Stutzerimonas stutzeri]|uniref:hypothetical protein n=1 Tax=Stutzerimonas stutzeri TaxID=316 RepID=UPI001BD5CCD2|nr:hypothetical protein [Stutzerimonas stutzeri]MBS9723815.1 hypothetical protein [Stutzerimonas stutzeri]
MTKLCKECKTPIIERTRQWKNKKYCSVNCRKIASRRKLAAEARLRQGKSMLVQVPHILYLVKECRRAGTIQILSNHSLESFTKTMDFIKNKPRGDIEICHIAPARGKNSRGLLHYKNLFYGGSYQNRNFGSNYLSGGLEIKRSHLMKKWAVDESMDNNTILRKVEAFLSDVIKSYIEINRLQKSKKRSRIEVILKIDPDRDINHLFCQNRKYLDDLLLELSPNRTLDCGSGCESKYIIYVDELTRFISYGGERARTLRKFRTLMVAGYVALEKLKASKTYNEVFYERYGSLIKPKYTHATLKNPEKWSEFKDFIYEAAFIALQGGYIDIKGFRKEFKLYLKPLQ